ncbi:MAG TPA: hypothetical protein VHE13_05035 [Opitutus sp.]|nr:hypothetical protein [Opitutus sp.]
MKKTFAQCALQAGQVEAALGATREYWSELARTRGNEAEANSAIQSGMSNVAQISLSLSETWKKSSPPIDALRSIALTAVAYGTTTAATSELLHIPGRSDLQVTLVPNIDYQGDSNLASRLESLDPALGAIARQIWECLYATNADPERSALFMMRQTWDYFFGSLAPDQQVKKSEFFAPKQGPRPDVVSRDERIRYALDRHIRREHDRARLFASAKHALNLYDELNRAHTRGELDRAKAVTSLHALNDWLVLWVDALENSRSQERI